MVNSTQIRGVVSARIYDTALLTYHDPTYPALPREAKQQVAEEIDPIGEHETSNVTCVGMHEWMAEALDGSTVAPEEPSHFALGRSNATPLVANRSLNDEVERVDITSFTNEGTSVRVTAYVGEAEANVNVDIGETISEGGVFAGDTLLNHSLFSIEYEKDSSKTMNVEAAFTFNDSSEVGGV